MFGMLLLSVFLLKTFLAFQPFQFLFSYSFKSRPFFTQHKFFTVILLHSVVFLNSIRIVSVNMAKHPSVAVF